MPVVEPTHISFTDVSPGVIQKASFIIRNIGGPYKKFSFSDPESWVWVTSYTSRTTPLKVEIEAKGKGWGRSYSESIRVKLDEEETRIIITLKTRPKPVITVSHAIAGVGILALFIIVSIIVSNVGRKNDKHSQSNLNQIKSGLSQPPYQDLPFPQRYVEDRTNIISDTIEKGLNGYLVELEQKTGTQMIVLTINTTGSIPIETYAIELATKWKLGQKGKDNGVLIIIAKDDRVYRIEIGRGLEKILPDSFCGTVGKTYFAPNFRKGQFSEGIYQGVVVIGDKIAEDFKQTPYTASTIKDRQVIRQEIPAPQGRRTIPPPSLPVIPSPPPPIKLPPPVINLPNRMEGKVGRTPFKFQITQRGNKVTGIIRYNNLEIPVTGEISGYNITLKTQTDDFYFKTLQGEIVLGGSQITGTLYDKVGNLIEHWWAKGL